MAFGEFDEPCENNGIVPTESFNQKIKSKKNKKIKKDKKKISAQEDQELKGAQTAFVDEEVKSKKNKKMKKDKKKISAQEDQESNVIQTNEAQTVANIPDFTRIVERYQPILEEVENISSEVLKNAKFQDLGSATEILEGISVRMKKLKNPNLNFFPAKQICNVYYSSKRSVEKRMFQRQNIHEGLTEAKIDFESKKNSLQENVGKVKGLIEISQKIQKRLENAIDDLSKEKEIIESQIETFEENDIEDRHSLVMARDKYDGLIVNMSQFKFLHDKTKKRLEIQLNEREKMYEQMSLLGPQLRTLIEQQLTEFILAKDVRRANEALTKTKVIVAQISMDAARESRENAEEFAKNVSNPVFDIETVNKIADEGVKMIENVSQIMIDARTNREESLKTLKAHDKKMIEALKKSINALS
jgi:uncharacterized protein YaaN involved in tellurite resistance